jgi:hypothetical protein
MFNYPPQSPLPFHPVQKNEVKPISVVSPQNVLVSVEFVYFIEFAFPPI